MLSSLTCLNNISQWQQAGSACRWQGGLCSNLIRMCEIHVPYLCFWTWPGFPASVRCTHSRTWTWAGRLMWQGSGVLLWRSLPLDTRPKSRASSCSTGQPGLVCWAAVCAVNDSSAAGSLWSGYWLPVGAESTRCDLQALCDPGPLPAVLVTALLSWSADLHLLSS